MAATLLGVRGWNLLDACMDAMDAVDAMNAVDAMDVVDRMPWTSWMPGPWAPKMDAMDAMDAVMKVGGALVLWAMDSKVPAGVLVDQLYARASLPNFKSKLNF